MTKTPEQIFDWLNANGQADIVEYITQLHNQSKQEPVAWMDEYGNVCTDIQKKMYQGNITAQYNYDKNTIPLYTTPQTKPLSDDEILDACITDGIYDCINDPYYDRNTNTYTLDADLIKFARAIEERHGIK